MEFINIPAWSSREVVDWLKGLDDCLQIYEPNIISQGITGLQLVEFSSMYLDKLGISKVGHQQLLLDAIQHLCHLSFQEITAYFVSSLQSRDHSSNAFLVFPNQWIEID
ncbi:Connector enhancer of kinase suppressor of ras 2 [Holothuria leucospilota]|uniref:Connector enhancer of kinase suppressor of ras 2 n=1 Tax=Holothuria leucospilota TaxID=206669 RepID=A0A9Q1BIA9_HOLLE|nr:Connector enhancer of kinase suppressor of ras 2 [Holothuria leucospilota]